MPPTIKIEAAAFGRLCVETLQALTVDEQTAAAAFGRLCVETSFLVICAVVMGWQPPSGGCVLKQVKSNILDATFRAAAFGRLCVETFEYCVNTRYLGGSRLMLMITKS